MSEKIYRSAAEEELINILARIALRIAVKKQTELTSGNKDNGSSEILQKKKYETKRGLDLGSSYAPWTQRA